MAPGFWKNKRETEYGTKGIEDKDKERDEIV